MCRRCAIQPDRLRVIHRHGKESVLVRAKAGPDRGCATYRLAGVIEGGAGDGVRGVDLELNDIAGCGGEGVWFEDKGVVADGYGVDCASRRGGGGGWGVGGGGRFGGCVPIVLSKDERKEREAGERGVLHVGNGGNLNV